MSAAQLRRTAARLVAASVVCLASPVLAQDEEQDGDAEGAPDEFTPRPEREAWPRRVPQRTAPPPAPAVAPAAPPAPVAVAPVGGRDRFGAEIGPAAVYVSGAGFTGAVVMGVTCRVFPHLGVRLSGGAAWSAAKTYVGGWLVEMTPRWGELAAVWSMADPGARLAPWASAGLAFVFTSMSSNAYVWYGDYGSYNTTTSSGMQAGLSLAAGLALQLNEYFRLNPQLWLAASPTTHDMVIDYSNWYIAHRGRLTGAVALTLELTWN